MPQSTYATVQYDTNNEPTIITMSPRVVRQLRQAGYSVRRLDPWLWEARANGGH